MKLAEVGVADGHPCEGSCTLWMPFSQEENSSVTIGIVKSKFIRESKGRVYFVGLARGKHTGHGGRVNCLHSISHGQLSVSGHGCMTWAIELQN